MEMIDTRIYDDIFLLAKIFKRTELNKDEKERLYKHFEKRKKGEWVPAKDGIDGHVKCNQCFKTYDYDSEAQYYNFCPNCGSYNGSDDNVNE